MQRQPRIDSGQVKDLIAQALLVTSRIIGATIAIPLDNIVEPSRKNHSEMSPHKFEALKQDVKKHCIEPHMDFVIAVRPIHNGQYEIVDGRHRYKIAQALEWKSVLCKIYNLSEKAARKLSIRRNNQHGDFTDALQDEIASLLKDGDSIEELVSDLAFTERELLDLAAHSVVPDELDKTLNSGTKLAESKSTLLEMKFVLSKEERGYINKAIDMVMDAKQASHPGAALARICRKYVKAAA